MPTRREARERALGLAYEAEIRDVDLVVIVAEQPVRPDDYACRLVEGVAEHAAEIDALLSAPSLRIDLAAETLTAPSGRILPFALDPLRKRFLLEGGYVDFLAGKRDAVRAWLAQRQST